MISLASNILASGPKSISYSRSEVLILTGVASDTGIRQGSGVSAVLTFKWLDIYNCRLDSLYYYSIQVILASQIRSHKT